MKCYIEAIGLTPDTLCNSFYANSSRGLEIELYMKYINIEKFIILDDQDEGISEKFEDNFIQIDDRLGFTIIDYHIVCNTIDKV